MIVPHRKLHKTLILLLMLLSGCVNANPASELLTPPDADWPTTEWSRSSPEAQGMDSEQLSDMLVLILEHDYDIDSLSVVRNGYLVLDVTIDPFRPGMKHNLFSCTKSILSVLIGIAIDEGYVEGVEQPVLDFFPTRTVGNLDANKAAMTLEHLLTMTTGLRCRDSYLYRWEGLYLMQASEDWVQFMLDLPMDGKPGVSFEYCNGASLLLSAILQETTGMDAYQFAETHLFAPLGITESDWPSDPLGVTLGWGDLEMLPHDMAKIGYLYLNHGQWEGKQIVSPSWVEDSTRKHTPATLEDGYGYQWWVDDSGMYLALGYSGQFIFVLPEENLVVVFTSHLEESSFYVPQTLLTDFIIPSASSSPLPVNEAGQERLENLIRSLAEP
jgi:CubicO group peptidase (beta-lactamase class C family)